MHAELRGVTAAFARVGDALLSPAGGAGGGGDDAGGAATSPASSAALLLAAVRAAFAPLQQRLAVLLLPALGDAASLPFARPLLRKADVLGALLQVRACTIALAAGAELSLHSCRLACSASTSRASTHCLRRRCALRPERATLGTCVRAPPRLPLQPTERCTAPSGAESSSTPSTACRGRPCLSLTPRQSRPLLPSSLSGWLHKPLMRATATTEIVSRSGDRRAAEQPPHYWQRLISGP